MFLGEPGERPVDEDRPERVLLVDDACTKGTTLSAAYAALNAAVPGIGAVAATAAQMTVRAVVRDPESFSSLLARPQWQVLAAQRVPPGQPCRSSL